MNFINKYIVLPKNFTSDDVLSFILDKDELDEGESCHISIQTMFVYLLQQPVCFRAKVQLAQSIWHTAMRKASRAREAKRCRMRWSRKLRTFALMWRRLLQAVRQDRHDDPLPRPGRAGGREQDRAG